MIPVVYTGVLGVLWYLWWQWWGKHMLRSSATALTVRQRFASGVGILSWNVSFFLLLIAIWNIIPMWFTLPMIVLAAVVSLMLNSWAKSRE